MKKIKVGIIGLGNMGMNHLRVYLTQENVELVSICDINKLNLEKAAKLCPQAKMYVDYNNMLAVETLDAVSIVVPTKYHKEVALAVIKKKIHFLLEKPIASTAAEAKEIISHTKENKVKCLIGHIERFNPVVSEVIKKIPLLGKVYTVNINRIGLPPIGLVDTGVIKELGVHDIDILLYIFQSKVKKVFALTRKSISTKFNDLLVSVLELENGVVVQLNINWVSPVKKREMVITGENGMLYLDYVKQELCYYKKPSTEQIYTDDNLFKRREGEVIIYEIDKREPLVMEIQHFLGCVIHDEKPLVSGEDGLRALETAEAIYAAAEKGGL